MESEIPIKIASQVNCESKKNPESPCCCGVFGISEIIPTRSRQTVSKRLCLGILARGIQIIRITLKVLAIVIFVVILLSG